MTEQGNHASEGPRDREKFWRRQMVLAYVRLAVELAVEALRILGIPFPRIPW